MADPFEAWSDADLQTAMLLLAIACGRGNAALAKKRRVFICFLFQALGIEASNRGIPMPQPPYHAPPKKSLPSAL